MKRSLIIHVFLALYLNGICQDVINVELPQTSLATPIQIKLAKPLPVSDVYLMRSKSSGETFPAQLIDSLTLTFIVPANRAAGKVSLTAIPKNRLKKTGLKLIKKSAGYLVTIDKKPILFYHTKESMPAPDSPSFYKRSGFIHPLYSPDGSILTDDFPVGHAHQHAIFTAWTNTTFRNKPVDFWNQHLQKGTVQHVAVVGIKEGPVFSELKTELKYISFEHGTVLKEFWTLRFYPFNDYYIFDLESEQQNATTDTLYLNPYHYGGLAFRGSREWNPDDKKFYRLPWNILTSEGLRDSSANQTHARWVDASGNISGKESGACVLNHVSNFRYPQGIRVHPQMPYWCFAPVIDGGFSIPPGAFYRSRYRYYVHKGKPDAAVIESFQKSWSAINQTSE